jgi:hypothetical protein
MRVYRGRGDKYSSIIALSTVCRWGISFKFRPFYSKRIAPLGLRLGGSQKQMSVVEINPSASERLSYSQSSAVEVLMTDKALLISS